MASPLGLRPPTSRMNAEPVALMPNAGPSPQLIALAHDAARSFSLWPELVCAIVEQESSWNPWALRYEPAFYARYIEPQLLRAEPSPTKPKLARAHFHGA